MITQRTNVEGLGEVATSVGNLTTNVKELGKLISIRDEAYARIHSGIGKADGTRVSMIVDYLKGEMPVLVRDGMNRGLARKLVKANSQDKYFSTGSKGQYEKARKIADAEVKSGISPEERRAIVCPSREVFAMSLTENSEHLSFAFQDIAKEYFERNRCPISFIPIDSSKVDAVDGTIQNYIWFRSFDDMSELLGNYRSASGCDSWARGGSIGREAPQKNSGAELRTPSLGEIIRYSKPFVPSAARKAFERGLRAKFEKQ